MTRYSMQTDPGVRYEDNEDSVGFDADIDVWLVADGMGGHAAGEVASRIAKDTFIERIRSGESPSAAAMSAHTAIGSSAEAQAAQQGMGSTLVAMQIQQQHAELVWVGDSRTYLWRDGQLSVATHDHSYVQMLIDQGQLTDESARGHPKRNMVTQVLGLGEPKPETRSLPLQQGDWLVLCSDGLNDELTDAEIAEILVGNAGDIGPVAQQLVDQAIVAGGRDNVSVLAIQYYGPSAQLITEPSVAAALDGQANSEVQNDAQSESVDSAVPSSSALAEFVRSPLFMGVAAAILVFLIFVIVTKGG